VYRWNLRTATLWRGTKEKVQIRCEVVVWLERAHEQIEIRVV
jgi:hypothetical protein